jgi:hypothetical protein
VAVFAAAFASCTQLRSIMLFVTHNTGEVALDHEKHTLILLVAVFAAAFASCTSIMPL